MKIMKTHLEIVKKKQTSHELVLIERFQSLINDFAPVVPTMVTKTSHSRRDGCSNIPDNETQER